MAWVGQFCKLVGPLVHAALSLISHNLGSNSFVTKFRRLFVLEGSKMQQKTWTAMLLILIRDAHSDSLLYPELIMT